MHGAQVRAPNDPASKLLGLVGGADIIRTVAVDPTVCSAGVLAVIVGIRTFLRFSLEVELEGRWPRQPREATGPSVADERTR